MAYRNGRIDRIRSFGQSRDRFSLRDIYHALRAQTYTEEVALKNAVYDLIKQSEVKRVGRDLFEYIAGRSPRPNVRNRIYRAMHVKGSFSSQHILKATDADRSYIRSIIRKLVKSGDLEITGKRKIKPAIYEKIFRVRHADNFYIDYVKDGS